MKNLFIVTALFLSLRMSAQPAPRSIINQMPYVEESASQPKQGLLDVQQALQSLKPLPDFLIPQALPREFRLTSQGKELMELSQEANGYLREGQPGKAVDLFLDAIEKWPEELGLWVALADSYFAAGEHRKAAGHYRKFLDKHPFHFQALNNLAWLYSTTSDPELKNLDEALKLVSAARLIQPRSHHVWSTYSQIYYEQGKYREASEAINKALQIAQQSRVNVETFVNYLVQRHRTLKALNATSLWE